MLIARLLPCLLLAASCAPRQGEPTPAPAPNTPAETAKPAPPTSSHWLADFDVAAKLAKEQGKELFVDFTGKGWCSWCKLLDDEVLSRAEFLSEAEKSYVLVALDFDNEGKSKADAPNPARNDELLAKHEVNGFPTILLISPDGEEFGHTGYKPGGPAAYVAHLKEVATSGKKALAEMAVMEQAFAAADEAGKAPLVETAIAKLAAMTDRSPLLARLGALVRGAFALDPKNEKGLKVKAIDTLLRAGVIEEVLAATIREQDGKNEQGLLEQLVFAHCGMVRGQEQVATTMKEVEDFLALGTIKDKKFGVPIVVNAVFWCSKFLDRKEDAKKFAKQAKELGPTDPGMIAFLDEVLAS